MPRSPSPTASPCIALRVIVLALLAATGPAAAAEFPLDVELRSGRTGPFGVVIVDEEPDGSLHFEVRLDPEVVGPRAELEALHFNLLEPVPGLAIETLDDVRRPYVLYPPKPRWRTRGAAGARFDWRVELDRSRGGGWLRHHRFSRSRRHRDRGGEDGVGRVVQFRLRAERALSIEDLLPVSMTRSGVTIQMAARVDHGTYEGERLCTIAGAYDPDSDPAPEPDPEPLPEPDPVDDPVPDPGAVPPAPPGCTWLIDLLTGEPTVLSCG